MMLVGTPPDGAACSLIVCASPEAVPASRKAVQETSRRNRPDITFSINLAPAALPAIGAMRMAPRASPFGSGGGGRASLVRPPLSNTDLLLKPDYRLSTAMVVRLRSFPPWSTKRALIRLTAVATVAKVAVPSPVIIVAAPRRPRSQTLPVRRIGFANRESRGQPVAVGSRPDRDHAIGTETGGGSGKVLDPCRAGDR